MIFGAGHATAERFLVYGIASLIPAVLVGWLCGKFFGRPAVSCFGRLVHTVLAEAFGIRFISRRCDDVRGCVDSVSVRRPEIRFRHWPQPRGDRFIACYITFDIRGRRCVLKKHFFAAIFFRRSTESGLRLVCDIAYIRFFRFRPHSEPGRRSHIDDQHSARRSVVWRSVSKDPRSVVCMGNAPDVELAARFYLRDRGQRADGHNNCTAVKRDRPRPDVADRRKLRH